jgi:CRP/FNR family transcriptional regulator, cyclic AMP receptor protein
MEGMSVVDGEPALLTIQRVALLRRLEFFSGVPGHVLAAVAAQADEVRFGPGDVVIRRGDHGDSLYIVVDGSISIDIGGHHVDVMGPGTVVGELAVLVSEPRSATVTAVDRCRLLQLGSAVFDELLLDYPEVARGVITALVRRFRSRDFGAGSAGTE